ncbi:S-adenosyl-L-methionine-dependent methyltransferase [Bimuria novae-zelandiae CBS 107.79]|uniref:S-adenosyl-L-methionine-dependent methyltransferase n=1 Tax=Bimuria novae-zelandiae CBS 107.79 TaxID=1447943 RepID=A0A6A5VF91_9PLEO|nr:S-adenosyl-L-methionine-dependent methyltransferase [Bimuria novae-zelandiae CBS 107.79]
MTNIREDLRRVMIHDREFQKYSVDRRIYCVPREEIRLETQHNILFQLFGERYFFPRIDNPTSILECGYGRGDWVVRVAEEYEECEVTGIDIYPVHLPDQPDNLTLFGYNLNDRLDDPEVFEHKPYDLIHSRSVAQGIESARWPHYIRDLRRWLKPAGWLQMAEYYLNIQSNNGSLTEQSALREWWRDYVRAMEESKRNPRVARNLGQLLTDAGCRYIGGHTFDLPVGGWRPEPHMARLGRESVEMVGELLESASLFLFTERLGKTAAQVESLNNAARMELRDPNLHLYVPM